MSGFFTRLFITYQLKMCIVHLNNIIKLKETIDD